MHQAAHGGRPLAGQTGDHTVTDRDLPPPRGLHPFERAKPDDRMQGVEVQRADRRVGGVQRVQGCSHLGRNFDRMHV